MDQRLFQAAHSGNIEALHQLLAEDPFILERVALASIPDTPLHIAVLAGETEFAKEIIRCRPRFAMELNKDGFTPLHIASANGHLEMVRELLKVGSSVCNLKDRDGRTALHLAAMKGKIDVLSEILSSFPESARELTPQGETMFHLAVKYNQVKAFRELMERLKFLDMLNAKDQEGNTILHLATYRKQTQAVALLVSKKFGHIVDVNAKNMKNLTAMDILDILLQTSCDANDLTIGQMLLLAHAVKSREITQATSSHDEVERTDPTTIIRDSLPMKSLWQELTNEISRELDDSPDKTRNALMVVAVLIASMTFQAGINPPGGVWGEDSREDYNGTLTQTKKHRAGEAVMGSHHKCYALFLIFNTTGFLMSLIIISLLTKKFPLKPWLRLAVVAMMTTYGCALCFVTPFHRWHLGRSLHLELLIIVFFFGAVASWKFWWYKKCVTIIPRRWNKDLAKQHSPVIQPLHSLETYSSESNQTLPS